MSTVLETQEVNAIAGALPIGLKVLLAGSQNYKEIKQKASRFFAGNGCEVVEVCNLFNATGNDYAALQHLITADLLYVVTGDDSTDSYAGAISQWLLLNAKAFGIKTAVSKAFTTDKDFNFIDAIVPPDPNDEWGKLSNKLVKDNSLEIRSIATAILGQQLSKADLTSARYNQELTIWGKESSLEISATKGLELISGQIETCDDEILTPAK